MPRLPLAVLVLAAGLAAQSTALPRRADIKVNRAASPVSTVYWYSWLVASPRGAPLPSDAGKKLAATNLVGYVTYADLDRATSSVPSLEFRRTENGGLDWGAPTELFRLTTGQNWPSNEVSIEAEGHRVFVVTPKVGTGAGIWVYASGDQGQTWSSINLSPGMAAGKLEHLWTDNRSARHYQFHTGLDTALENGVLHVVYEVVDKTVANNTKEDVYYASVQFKSGKLQVLTQETRINRATQPGKADCDHPVVDAEAAVVTVAWQDDRLAPGNEAANQTFTMTSLALGLDWPSAKEVNHSNRRAALSTATWGIKVDVEAPNIYVTSEDSRGGADAVWLSYSNDSGRTWTRVQASKSSADITEHHLRAEGNRVAIVYQAGTTVYSRIDDKAGAGFKAGTPKEVTVSVTPTGGGSDRLFALDMRGDMLATAYETPGAGGENAYLAISSDAGASWSEVPVFTQNGDCDEPYCALTGNGDVLYSWTDNRTCGTNACNDTFVSGLKLPLLVDRTAQQKGVQLLFAEASKQKPAALLVSLTGTKPPIVLDRIGFSVNLAFDSVTGPALGIPAFLALVGPNGQATWNLPNLKTITGRDVWVAAITLDLGRGFVQFSDPHKF